MPPHKKGRTGETAAEEDGGAVFEEEEEEEEEEAEEEEEEDDEEDEEDEEDDPRATGTGYYTAHADGPRKSGRLKSRLADLPGGEPRELAKRVHAVMSEGSGSALSDELRGLFSPRYDEWRSLLHSGFSLLLHGYGSKKQLIRDFVQNVDKGPSDTVHSFSAYVLNARPRELMFELMQKAGLPHQGGSAAALCNQLRLAFAAGGAHAHTSVAAARAAASARAAARVGSVESAASLVLQLLPGASVAHEQRAELDAALLQAELDSEQLDARADAAGAAAEGAAADAAQADVAQAAEATAAEATAAGGA